MTGPGITVLHVLEAVRGGTSRHVADVVRYSTGVNHHVVVPTAPPAGRSTGGALYDSAAVARMKADGAVVHEVDMRRRPAHPVNALAAPRLRALIRLVGADVVHGHSSVGGALARPAGWAAGVPVAYTPNGVAQSAPYRAVERALGRITDRWIAVSDSEAEMARSARLVAPDRIAVIPNGIDLSEPATEGFDVRARLGLSPSTPVVGTVARLVPQKDPALFVRTAAAVAAAVPEAHFLLIGMGPLQATVDAEVAAAGLAGRWHQIAHVEAAAGVVGQIDVFVLASSFEGAPYTPLEAMRAGVPVVLTDVVGNRDSVEDGRSGFLRPPGDPAGLAEPVVRLLGDPALRRQVVAAASDRLRACFDVEKMGAAVSRLYLDMVTARRNA